MRSLPENSDTNRSGSECSASEIAARRSPAAQPSVRSCSNATPASESVMPVALSSCRVSSGEKRRSESRSSVSRPASRRRCRPSPGSSRVPSSTRSSNGSRVRNSSSQRSASADSSSWRSSITSTARPSSKSKLDSSCSTRALPRKLGDGLTRSTNPSPATPANASITESQNRCASCSPRSTDTHATRSPRPSGFRPTTAAAPTCHSREARRAEPHRPGEPLTISLAAPRAGQAPVAPGGARAWRGVSVAVNPSGPACKAPCLGRPGSRNPFTRAEHLTCREVCQGGGGGRAARTGPRPFHGRPH